VVGAALVVLGLADVVVHVDGVHIYLPEHGGGIQHARRSLVPAVPNRR
jgi:hypothetical protein